MATPLRSYAKISALHPNVRLFFVACHALSWVAGEMGDAVIICGSSVTQVKANVDACRDETPLPKVSESASRSLAFYCTNRTDETHLMFHDISN